MPALGERLLVERTASGQRPGRWSRESSRSSNHLTYLLVADGPGLGPRHLTGWEGRPDRRPPVRPGEWVRRPGGNPFDGHRHGRGVRGAAPRRLAWASWLEGFSPAHASEGAQAATLRAATVAVAAALQPEAAADRAAVEVTIRADSRAASAAPAAADLARAAASLTALVLIGELIVQRAGHSPLILPHCTIASQRT
jgi:hypothetical protein